VCTHASPLVRFITVFAQSLLYEVPAQISRVLALKQACTDIDKSDDALVVFVDEEGTEQIEDHMALLDAYIT
jgi:hypothetical protein